MPDTATMLEEVGGRIPTAEDLDRAYDSEISTSSVERLVMSLSRWCEDNLVLTAEQAWHLHDFAQALQMIGESLCGWGKEIEGDVMAIWSNTREPLAVAGGDDA